MNTSHEMKKNSVRVFYTYKANNRIYQNANFSNFERNR